MGPSSSNANASSGASTSTNINIFADFVNFDFETGTSRVRDETETNEPGQTGMDVMAMDATSGDTTFDDLFNLDGMSFNFPQAVPGTVLDGFDLNDLTGGIDICGQDGLGIIETDPIMQLFSDYEKQVAQSNQSSRSQAVNDPISSIYTGVGQTEAPFDFFSYPDRDENFVLHTSNSEVPSATWSTTPALGPPAASSNSTSRPNGALSPETLYPLPVNAKGEPDPAVLNALGLPPLAGSSARASAAGPSRIRTNITETSSNNRLRQQSPYAYNELETRERERGAPTNGPTKRVKGKATGKARSSESSSGTTADKNTWHIITQPQSAEAESALVASAVTANGKRGLKRKDVFQRVERPGEKPGRPEWCEPPLPWKPPPSMPIPKKDRGPHSEMGWVLARLREPHCERAQYGWAVAEVHVSSHRTQMFQHQLLITDGTNFQNPLQNPLVSSYLILSGPHSLQVKKVRPYDRIAYSQEAIDNLKTKHASSDKEKVYDEIKLSPEQLVTHSSVYGTDLAFNHVAL
jgi:hypothetical protein